MYTEIETDCGGFTIIEYLVVIGLVTLISSSAFAIYHFSSGFLHRQHKRMHIESACFLVLNAIASDVQSARQVRLTNSDMLLLVDSKGRTYSYTLEDSTLLRNGKKIHPSDIRIASLRFLTDDNAHKDSTDKFTTNDTETDFIEIMITTRLDEKQFTLTTGVKPRINRFSRN
ncbi:MAG: hypothetical protein V2J62_09935 [candidate division KSB1 bacterium]|jgi:type II secretory pathway pseudopilin PulG|nr:hypothetical protein [candidate division KSB1 bacterium]